MKNGLAFNAVIAALALLASPASAIPRTWVSSTGGGAACTRAAPCATFQDAHDATDENGEINCLDAGEFGRVFILRSITIDCTGVVGGIVGPASSTGIRIYGGGDYTVRLRGLTIRSAGEAVYIEAGHVWIENCKIFDSTNGITMIVSGGVGHLHISDTLIEGSGNYGIWLDTESTNPSSLRAVLDGVRVQNSSNHGILATNQLATRDIILHVRNSVVTNAANHAGILGSGIPDGRMPVGPGVVSITLDRTSLTLNATGAAADARTFLTVGRSTVISNSIGLLSSRGGNILSYQNNHLTGNSTDGAPTGAVTLK